MPEAAIERMIGTAESPMRMPSSPLPESQSDYLLAYRQAACTLVCSLLPSSTRPKAPAPGLRLAPRSARLRSLELSSYSSSIAIRQEEPPSSYSSSTATKQEEPPSSHSSSTDTGQEEPPSRVPASPSPLSTLAPSASRVTSVQPAPSQTCPWEPTPAARSSPTTAASPSPKPRQYNSRKRRGRDRNSMEPAYPAEDHCYRCKSPCSCFTYPGLMETCDCSPYCFETPDLCRAIILMQTMVAGQNEDQATQYESKSIARTRRR
jgi:hypothetical protein